MDNEYIKRLDQIQRDLNWVISYLLRNQKTTPTFVEPPRYPEPNKLTLITCPTCNMTFDGATSYSCPNNDCPLFTKITF